MFRFSVLGFLAGILSVLIINQFNPWLYVVPLVLTAVLLCKLPRSIKIFIILYASGFAWVLFTLQQYNSWQLPVDLQKKPLTVQATILSVPVEENHTIAFIARLDQFQHQKTHIKVKVDWYNRSADMPQIIPGQQWQLTVKLERPHSLMNPGSFDYVTWLVQHDIHATGYVVSGKLIASASRYYWINQIRQKIKVTTTQLLGDRYLANFINALTVGVRENITLSQWQVLQKTGTNHLIAIAGLHIGLVTGLVFFVVSFIWKRIPGLALWIATPRVAAGAALMVAWCYAALAGFTLPTERAVVMLSVFLGSIMLRAFVLPWSAWCLALFITLILDPLAVLAADFWLSFIAVALIIFTAGSRITGQNKWWCIAKIQIALAAGLFPITLLFFHNGSLIAPVANAIAIPIVGFLTVPLSLLGAITSFISLATAKVIFIAALHTLWWAWYVLEYFSSHSYYSYQLSLQSWQVIAISMGIFLLLLPRGLSLKSLAIIFLLPLFFQKTPVPKPGDVWLTVLDVGQGLSVVVQTAEHVLIYDTGAKYSDNYDMGSAVIVPYLQYFHIPQLSKIMISHGDNDHIGGLQSVLKFYPTPDITTSVPAKIPHANYCMQGQQWQWDGVDFKVLYPDKQHLNLDNNSSCVLRITVGDKHILLTGDIEKLAEDYLVRNEQSSLAATILVAPHHGSKTSSTAEFVAAVKPEYVVFPTGYLNRFNFPGRVVVKRYQQSGAKLYNTATEGAISFIITPQAIQRPQCYADAMRFKYAVQNCYDTV